MRNVFAALAAAFAALAIAGPVGAGVVVGVNDDAGKYSDGAPQFWQVMKENNLKQNAITVLWDETQPTAILDEGFISNALPVAAEHGITVVFDVYPMHSQALTSDPANIQKFGAFITKLAQRFPSVTEYVVMNECNQPRFLNPQFTSAGVNQSAAVCGQALAAAYDALKVVNPSNFVWGIGVSPRGNDNAQATSNVSTSPVNFIKALGAWFKSSGRTKPIMDGFDFHPYPIPQSLPFATGYADQENAAVSNLARIYQAFYDAFNGSAQPTIGQQPGGGLPVSLNEVGIQTDNVGKPGYTGLEVSATPEGGVRGETATESFQSSWYLQMLNYVACDPNVKVVNLFHLVDETALEGWQSGLYYAGYSPKQSAAAVSGWIAQTGGNCVGASRPWSPAATGPTTTPGKGPISGITTTGRISELFATRFAATLGGSSLNGLLRNLSGQLGTARQNTNATVGLIYVGSTTTTSARSLSSASVKPVASVKAFVRKGLKLKVTMAAVTALKPGYYKLRYDFKAAKGNVRATLTTKAFYLLGNGKLRK